MQNTHIVPEERAKEVKFRFVDTRCINICNWLGLIIA